jgi:hypothetical protein
MRSGEVDTTHRGRVGALVVAIVSLVLLTVYVLGGILGWWPVGVTLDDLPIQIMMILFLALGPLILWKAHGNRVGWAFSAIGLGLLLAALSGSLADRGMIAFSAIGGAFWLGWIVALGTLVLWYPTGEVPSRRWLWLQWLGFLLVALTVITYTFTEQICVDGEGTCLAWVENPIGISGVPNPEYGWLAGPLFSLYPLFMGAALWSLFTRYRRAGTVERLQLKWFLLACLSFVAALSTEFVFEALGYPEAPLVVDVWIDLSLVSIPVAATLAILRYRLFEIDRIISRTVTYAIVIVLLALVYVLGVTSLTTLLDTDSPFVVAGSTLAVAALFNPLRRRVQRRVDHRFNRTKYDAERVMAGFTGSLRDEVDPDTVVDGWVGVVSETMHPASVGVWVRA